MTNSKNEVRISIIMHVYNAAKFLPESISSILNQTFTDFDFIIIDDCSIDNSWEIIQAFSDSRIIAIRNEKNTGTYPSRNSGISLSKGRYITMMDANGIALPDRLTKQYDYMENNPDVLALGTQYEYSGTDYKVENPVSYPEICAGLLNANCILHSSLLIRTDFIKQNGGYDEQYKYASDYDLVCRLCLTGKIENLPDIYMVCRMNPDQVTDSKQLEQNRYTDLIRQKYQIAFINKYKSAELPEVNEAETGYPDMGRVIGLYIMGECFNQSFQDSADSLLAFIIDNVNSSKTLSLKNGILGIGSGIIYLLRNRFVDGDEDDVLESLDEVVFSSILNFQEELNFDWEGTSYYLRKRALMQNSKNMSARQKIKKISKVFKNLLPKKVRIDASTLCQLNCKSCYMRKNNFGTLGKGYLKFADFKNFIQNNKFVRNIELSNSGEIFLNPDLLHILKYAFDNNIELEATNGVNFNHVSDEILDALVKYKFKFITFSIDGASQDIYSMYRINGNFDTVVENIKRLNTYKQKYHSQFPMLSWQYILMEHNEGDVIKAKMIAEELQVRIFFKLTWDEGYIPQNIEMLKRETGLKHLTGEELFNDEGRDHIQICNQLWDSPQINWDGRLLGCCLVYTDDFGVNVFEIGLENAIKSKNYKYAKKMLQGEVGVPSKMKNLPCANCMKYKTMVETRQYIF